MRAGPHPRRRTDRLWIRTVRPRAQDALDLIAAEPGLTVEELGKRLGVSLSRTWQLILQLEYSPIQRQRGPTQK
jgi:DNA-binding IclR family transcriptional regulator